LARLHLAAGRTVRLRLTVTLPHQSPPALAGQTTAVFYSFAGIRAKRR
jgi:hypothetical protein